MLLLSMFRLSSTRYLLLDSVLSIGFLGLVGPEEPRIGTQRWFALLCNFWRESAGLK